MVRSPVLICSIHVTTSPSLNSFDFHLLPLVFFYFVISFVSCSFGDN